DDKKTAWFDEILYSKGYGNFRGTGVLKIEGSQWKIAQYNLLLPIPNQFMKKYATEIKAFYKQK
ncbi:MAG: SnoaL-like domain-containing protein, partial [Candidatus Marinimicrobia bacterium]|nr:SnoaL-like domain-containing protein [Candidatus Neomarinimicrobiota bacterium]